MEDTLENKLGMYQKTQGWFVLHAAETAGIAAVATVKAEFDSKVNSILLKASAASADITGYTVLKQAKREVMETAIMKISVGVVFYANMNGLPQLSEKCDETSSAMKAMRDDSIYSYAQVVIQESTPVMASLVPYGVVAADLTAATLAASEFLKVIQEPHSQINERGRTLDQLKELFDETDAFLIKKLDPAINLFKVTNPDLVDSYLGARTIDDTGAYTPPDYEGVAHPNDFSLIAEFPYVADRVFDFKNTGNVPLEFALSAGMTLEGTTVLLPPGGAAQRQTDNLNSNSLATKLIVRNDDVGVGGSYKVWVSE